MNAAKNTAHIGHTHNDNADREDVKGIHRQTEVQVYVGDSDSDAPSEDLDMRKTPSNNSGENNYHHGAPQYNTNNPFEKSNNRLSDESQIPLKNLNRAGEAV